ncbi:MAG: LysR family transcriptional regulator [Kofleriaceae bacterium]|nr:LysR family transcriptional regulator [Kofleriaceae bacterium]MCB9574038.1 LysR family transcriptional regulator [Kofleriaceae bacterium]
MLEWDDLRVLLAIHRTGSFAGAAAGLGLNPTTVGRRLAALEERAETRLFDRTPDGFVLSPAGRDILPRAERIEAEVQGVERELAGADQRLAGPVRITVTEMLVTRFVAPHLARFARAYPDITLEVSCTNAVINLARRDADVALRLARPREPDVISKELAEIALGLYASRGYLEGHGHPDDPERGLAGHTVVGFASARPFRVENEWFDARTVDARVAMRSDSVSSIYAATAAGLGIGLLPRAVADHDPALVHLPTETAPRPRVIWQTIHKDLRTSARVRAVTDFLAEILAPA